MRRSFLPFLLVILGYLLILLATKMPLFEWQIMHVSTDYPAVYEINAQPSPWRARLGESLDHGSYPSFGNILVSKDARDCAPEDVSILVERASNDITLERISLDTKKYVLWLFDWKWIVIALSLIYIWWFTIWFRHPMGEAVVLTIIVIIAEHELTQLIRNVLPTVMRLGMLECYRGTVTFQANLSEVHYETLAVMVVGLLAELGALIIMLSQVIKALLERNTSPS